MLREKRGGARKKEKRLCIPAMRLREKGVNFSCVTYSGRVTWIPWMDNRFLLFDGGHHWPVSEACFTSFPDYSSAGTQLDLVSIQNVESYSQRNVTSDLKHIYLP